MEKMPSHAEIEALNRKSGSNHHQHTYSQKPKIGFLLGAFGLASTIGAAVPVGYNIGVINSPAEYIINWCNQTLIEQHSVYLTLEQLHALWSGIISVFLVGGCIGSLFGASFADRFGRKGSFLISGVLFIIGAVMFYLCRGMKSLELLILGRLIVGLASGLTTTTVPMYLAELAPLEHRGTLAVLVGLGVTGGVVVAQVATLQEFFGTDANWHIALSAYVLLVLLCYIPYPWFPESPTYLYIVAGKKERAKRELQRLRGNDAVNRVNDELDTMALEASSQTETRSLWSVITDKKLLMPIILVCALQGGQQLSGVNAVFYYSVVIFQNAGLSAANAKWANLGAGCVNLLTALFTPLIMKKFNRRPVIMGSCFFAGVFLVILTFVVKHSDEVSWFPMACVFSVFGYILAYQIGLGPIPYFIGSELFEVAPRPAAMSLGSLASWFCNFFVGMTFLLLQTITGAYVFLPFAIVCFGLVALMFRYLPETRCRQTADIVPLVSHGFASKRA